MITNLEDLCVEVGYGYDGSDPAYSIKLLEKAIYKGTECGAWIECLDNGVRMGSIVEGAEECTGVSVLEYPFSEDDFWDSLSDIEIEATQIWNDTHGCEDCWPDGYIDEWGNDRQFGFWPINPECETCKGEGVIL